MSVGIEQGQEITARVGEWALVHSAAQLYDTISFFI